MKGTTRGQDCGAVLVLAGFVAHIVRLVTQRPGWLIASLALLILGLLVILACEPARRRRGR